MQPHRVPRILLEVVRQKKNVYREAMALFRPGGFTRLRRVRRAKVCVRLCGSVAKIFNARAVDFTYVPAKQS